MHAHPGHDILMAALRRAAFTDDGALLFVHAGVDTGRPLATQGDALWWGGSGFESMTEPYGEFRMVVRGFDRARKGLRLTRVTASLDDGCGFGGLLRAGCFDRAGRLVDVVEV
jgi:serine/threonine protein phosphatase 1